MSGGPLGRDGPDRVPCRTGHRHRPIRPHECPESARKLAYDRGELRASGSARWSRGARRLKEKLAGEITSGQSLGSGRQQPVGHRQAHGSNRRGRLRELRQRRVPAITTTTRDSSLGSSASLAWTQAYRPSSEGVPGQHVSLEGGVYSWLAGQLASAGGAVRSAYRRLHRIPDYRLLHDHTVRDFGMGS